MKREELEAQVIHILRRSALSGSDRQIDLLEPLGSLGVGLDSLALIEFATALEKHFQLLLPDSIWSDGGQLTLARFTDIIQAHLPAAASVMPSSDQSGAQQNGDAAPALDHPAQKQGWRRWRLVTQLGKTIYYLYHREKWLILEYIFTQKPLPAHSSPLNLQLRVAAPDDSAALTSFWNTFKYQTIDGKVMDMHLFQERQAAGAVCLTAWLGEKIVGMDWLFKQGYYWPYAGVRFDWPADSCYGGELWEPPDYHGMGIGMELLAFSLAEAKSRGFRRQVTLVYARNVKMLSASLQLYGFTLIGNVDLTKVLSRPFSKWVSGPNAGRGGTVIM